MDLGDNDWMEWLSTIPDPPRGAQARGIRFFLSLEHAALESLRFPSFMIVLDLGIELSNALGSKRPRSALGDVSAEQGDDDESDRPSKSPRVEGSSALATAFLEVVGSSLSYFSS